MLGCSYYDRNSNTLHIQPIYPVSFYNKWVLINRAINPIETFPDFSQSSGSITGLGDINYTAWLSPPPGGGGFTWGFGFVSIWPTATDDILGSGKLSLGPSFVLVNATEKLMLAAVISDWFSVAGDADRPDVNTFYLQYIITYFLANKWYLSSAPINTANWEAESGQRWTIPIGGGFWALGIESIRLLTNSEFEPLVDLAKKRLEPQLVETEPPSALINH